MTGFRRIGHRILFAVGIVVAVGMSAVIVLYGQRLERSILAQNEDALTKVTDSTVEGLQAIMLRGYAEIAGDYARRLKRVADVIDFRIMRPDGREAFIDNATIDAVNAALGEKSFPPRSDPQPAPRLLDPLDRHLALALRRADHVIFYETGSGGERTVTVLEPVRAQPECRRCHVNAPAVLGLVKLTTSLKAVDRDVAATWRMSILVVLIGVAGIFLVVWFVARRSLVRPITSVTDAMAVAARGDLTISVPVTGGGEIGAMAGSFNLMSRRLLGLYAGLASEQNKLTTIILGAHEGIVVTDAARNVTLVNPAAVELLGKTEAEIAAGGLLELVDDPEWMEWRFASEDEESRAGFVEYNGRILMIEAATTRLANGEISGSTAILRDVTEEKRIETELQRKSITDALTGLYNRRHFDARLEAEFRRWQRYRGAFSVAMLDVDHFKQFNDTHGHECGDRVLQAIGGLLAEIRDRSAIACRYGGEELVLILPDLAQEAAIALAEDVRRRIEALVIDGLRVSVSIGVAGCPPQAPERAEAILKAADEALYRAKQGGRNRVAGA